MGRGRGFEKKGMGMEIKREGSICITYRYKFRTMMVIMCTSIAPRNLNQLKKEDDDEEEVAASCPGDSLFFR